MSEPDSGSDLASIRTRAARNADGDWVVNGAKVWTSNAHHSHYGIVLVRTSPVDTANRHAGMSQLLVDLSLPGITINPIRILDGGHHFNEVVFDDVVVPGDMLLGEEGNGWHQVTAELAFERSGPERFLSTYPLVAEFARRVADSDDPAALATLGRLSARLLALRQMSLRIAAALDRGELPEHPGGAGEGRGDDVRGGRDRGDPPGGRRDAVAGLARSAGPRAGRGAAARARATRCAAGPTRSCAGSWRADWACDELDQDLVVETVRDILTGFEPFVLTPGTPVGRRAVGGAGRGRADRGRAARGGRRFGRRAGRRGGDRAHPRRRRGGGAGGRAAAGGRPGAGGGRPGAAAAGASR